MEEKIIRINKPINQIDNFTSFTIIGDPGCDGLGAEIMSTFAKALTSIKSDFGIILGDIVPFGSHNLYANIRDFINAVSVNPVYLISGNHDTGSYSEYLGMRNYLLFNDSTLFIMLDDSKRTFSEETLKFLNDSLNEYNRKNILILFHIPPPNRFTKNTVNNDEWEKIRNIYLPYKDKIKYFLCGHVHSFFEDEIDGIKLLVSGGAGARLENIDESLDMMKTFHHILNFHFDGNNNLVYKHHTLDGEYYDKELNDRKLMDFLTNALYNESLAHIKYKIFAQDAQEKGLTGIAKLFCAASDAEFYHARNHFYVLNKSGKTLDNIKESINGENYEVKNMYREYLDYALEKGYGLSAYTFHDALEAEKIHYNLFSEALTALKAGKDIEVYKYFTCSSCGYSFRMDKHPSSCPVCGAPRDKIFEVA